jgi:hypothetical protein
VLFDVVAGLEQVVALCAHEVHGLGEAVLDEVVASGFVTGLLGAIDVDFRQAVVDDVSGEKVDAPGESLFDLRLLLAVVHRLPRAQLPVVLPDLAVPAPPGPRWVLVAALDLPGSVRTLTLPPVHQRKLAELYPLWQWIQQADTSLGALHRFLLALEALVDHGGSLGRGRHVAVDLLVLPEGGGDDWPLGSIGLVL